MTHTKVPDEIFPITTFISELPSSLVPQSLPSSSENGPVSRRLVIVGDVHGMRKSLEALLVKVGFDKGKGDHLILTGDLVNKGPDSPGVVDLAVKLGASAVRGNHDNAVLNAAAEIKATRVSLQQSGGLTGSQALPKNPEVDVPGDTVQDFEIPDKGASATTGASMKHSAATYTTALALSTRQLDWLATLPLILRVKLPPNLTSPFGDTLIVVHAGLVPGIPLEAQDPHAIMHMRSLDRTPGDESELKPAEASGEEGWAMEWDRWLDKVASKTTVIFGHDAKRRLQLGRYTIGLDSACLYGHRLSALVITASDREIEHQIIQVECADEPVAPTA
ncbi:putative metallophosphoesterase YNL217W [Aspergillus udagawae]|uniref:Putative metallophosphoesterase YNL217W n=1 Tax=Aspergillus udagawae TaxID=91492 RepID=A0A8H3N0T5_9EURO|nr:putative metallophosphoesterase YNL217W [Aspergillus udagawae]